MNHETTLPPGKHLAFYCSSTSWGGLEMNVVRFARWMHERNGRVTLFLVEGSPLWHHAVESGLAVRAVVRNRKYLDVVRAWRLSRLFRELEVDILWYRDNRDLDTLAWTKVFCSRPLKLVYQQAMQISIPKRDPVHSWRFKKIDLWIAPLHFLAKQVIELTRFPEKRIRVIPLAIDWNRFSQNPESRSNACAEMGLDPTRNWIGLAGRFDRLKGQDVLLEAFRRINDRYPNAGLVFAGESTRNEGNDYEITLHRSVKEYGLADRVVFLPFTDRLERFYRAVDIFVLASTGETFGMVTIEAMASGCAVVGTRASGTPEIMENGSCGMLFAPGNAEELASCLATLLGDEKMRLSLGEKARNSAALRFSHHAVLEAIEKSLSHL